MVFNKHGFQENVANLFLLCPNGHCESLKKTFTPYDNFFFFVILIVSYFHYLPFCLTLTTCNIYYSCLPFSLYVENMYSIIPFPHDKILKQTKLTAFADDKLNVTKMIISVFDRVENIVGKRRNCLYKQRRNCLYKQFLIACTSNFSFRHNVFKRLLSQTFQKVSLCGNGLKHYT